MPKEEFQEHLEAHCEMVHDEFEDQLIRRVDRKLTNCKEDLNDKIDALSEIVAHTASQVSELKEQVQQKMEKEDTRIEQIIDAWNNAKGALWFAKIIIYILGLLASLYIFIKSNFLIQLK